MSQITIAATTAFLLVFGVSTLTARGDVLVGAKVAAAEQVAISKIDHSVWTTLLQKYCDRQGYVDYQAWHHSSADRKQLDQYLTHLSQANPALPCTQASQFAFWINAYNAVTIKGILREYPTSSIRNHTAKLIGYNIWDDLLLPVGGKEYSLNQMEHEVLRKMGDPRIHFAIVCASIGCPPLLNEAYLAGKLDAQLTNNAKRFFADPTKFVATDSGELKLSPILKWFSTDFGNDQAARLRTIAPYLPSQTAQELASSARARVTYLDYDWALNDKASLRN